MSAAPRPRRACDGATLTCSMCAQPSTTSLIRYATGRSCSSTATQAPASASTVPGSSRGDLRHPDVGERPARLALDLQQELELVVAGRADPRHARAARRWRATTPAIVSGMIATITHWAIGPTTPPTSSQRLPSCWPATISAVFHTSEPVSVSAR